jgi:hypothetical protein
MGELPLMRQLGEGWLYDSGLTVLGVLIAHVSSQLLEAFITGVFSSRSACKTSDSVSRCKR